MLEKLTLCNGVRLKGMYCLLMQIRRPTEFLHASATLARLLFSQAGTQNSSDTKGLGEFI